MITTYTKQQLLEMIPHWGKQTVDNMFKNPDFPAQKQGKTHFVEEDALKEYFKVRHEN